MASATQPLPRQPVARTDWAPTAKVSVGALAGAATTLLIVILRASDVKAIDSPEVGCAITTLITFVMQYWVPERK